MNKLFMTVQNERSGILSFAVCHPYLLSHSCLLAGFLDSCCMRATGIPPPPTPSNSIPLIFIFLLSFFPATVLLSQGSRITPLLL